MDIDNIKKTIQDFFNEGTVTIVGSGLSLAEGIPGMGKLASELQSKIPLKITEASDIRVWKEIDDALNKGIGLEEALHNTKPSSYIEEEIRKITAKYIGNAEINVLEDIIQEKRVLRFSEYLQNFTIRNQGLTVITTNYDRLIEYACEKNGIRIDTLFIGKYLAQFEPEHSQYMFCNGIHKRRGTMVATYAPKVIILKPHGCLSWHWTSGKAYSIPHLHSENCLIITPGLNKYKEGYSVPFDTHRAKANDAIDNASRYIIIGYGFGDDHLETHLLQQLNSGKPALILTYTLSAKAEALVKKYNNITAICHMNSNDTRILNTTEDITFKDINLWDLHEMLKEVF